MTNILEAEIERLQARIELMSSLVDQQQAKIDENTLKDWQQAAAVEAGSRREYQNKCERLLRALEPFQRNAHAYSLATALGHISREDLLTARAVYDNTK